jgi:Uma2 family endonuclease
MKLEEFLELPDAPGKQELLNGELISLPPAKKSHAEICTRLFDLFTSVLDDSRV